MEKTNIQINGSKERPILLDVMYKEGKENMPVVIFAHGFKGFKDWGHFNLVGKALADAGFLFVKFNFSHNGTTVQKPDEFADLEAFGENNFSIELNDLGLVIDWICGEPRQLEGVSIDTSNISLIGHSRGGGIVLLRAAQDPRVKKVVTWASVCVYGEYWSKEQMEQWKKDGVMYVPNSRTKQNMPLYYQMYEDFYANKDRLDIPAWVNKLDKPLLIFHGTKDDAVPVESAKSLHEWGPNSELIIMEDANHVFGAKHPYEGVELPEDSAKVVAGTIDFLKR